MQNNAPQHDHDQDVGSDLQFTSQTKRNNADGTWVSGTLCGHRFEALVFAGHALNPDWEIGDSRITKLWLQRLADQEEVYNWDRGEDHPPADKTAAAIVQFPCDGLAEATYGE